MGLVILRAEFGLLSGGKNRFSALVLGRHGKNVS